MVSVATGPSVFMAGAKKEPKRTQVRHLNECETSEKTVGPKNRSPLCYLKPSACNEHIDKEVKIMSL